LSKHGYTTRWGFFEGTCSGANHLPFEQDIGLIEGMIDYARKQAAELRQTAVIERENANPEDCWYHVYYVRHSRFPRSCHQWTKTRIFKAENGILCYQHPGDDKKQEPHPERLGVFTSFGLIEIANELGDKYARHLEVQANKRDEYARWQEQRIRDWKPMPLVPVED